MAKMPFLSKMGSLKDFIFRTPQNEKEKENVEKKITVMVHLICLYNGKGFSGSIVLSPYQQPLLFSDHMQLQVTGVEEENKKWCVGLGNLLVMLWPQNKEIRGQRLKGGPKELLASQRILPSVRMP